MRRRLQTASVLVLISVIGIVVCATMLVYGQPTTQPVVVVPVASSAAWTWLVANSGWFVPLVGNILASIAVALKRWPRARGVARALWIVVGWFSSVEFRDGKRPGLAFKLPLTLPTPPPDSPKVS